MEEKILQIIPANGWSAKYTQEDGDFTSPLVCWALVEDEDGTRRVVGLDGADYVDTAECAVNFQRYIYESESGSAYQ